MAWMSGLICLDWYDWNQYGFPLLDLTQVHVGIDLFGLIRLKRGFDREMRQKVLTQSGLICLDWYDWNTGKSVVKWNSFPCRDWSVWIDTIETITPSSMVMLDLAQVGIDLFGLIRLKLSSLTSYSGRTITSGLICLDWYDWNYKKYLYHRVKRVNPSGLICLDWYDWNSAIKSLAVK